MKRLIVALLATTLLAACSDNGPLTGGGFTGNYALVSINTFDLPVQSGSNSNFTTYINAGTLTLNVDHTYTLSITYQDVYTDNSTINRTEVLSQGTYSGSGNSITLTDDSSGATG